MLIKFQFLLCLLIISISFLAGCDTSDPSTDDSEQQSKITVCKDAGSDYNTIQNAIDAAAAGSVIEVCPGTYSENLVIQNKALTLRAEQSGATTVIKASTSGSTVRITGVDAPGVVIEGFSIRGGINTGGMGGGVVCQESTLELTNNMISGNNARNGGGVAGQNCSVDVRENEIFDNKATQRGGGAFFDTCNGGIEQNRIHDNNAQEGGGLAIISIGFQTTLDQIFDRANGQLPSISQIEPVLLASSQTISEDGESTSDSLKVTGNTINQNSASPPRCIRYNIKESGGGGIWVGGDSPIIDNVIKDNESTINGGGIYVLNANSTIVDNRIIGNKTGEDGAGMCINTCAGRIADNFITENNSMDDAGGLRVYFGINMVIENNTVSKNTAVDASGGVKLSHAQNDFVNNLLEENKADTAGALELDNDASIIRNCIFKGNQARLGAAIHSKAAEGPFVIKNSTFKGNIATQYGGALHFEDNAYPVTLTGITASNNQAAKGGVIATNNSQLELTDAVLTDNIASETGGALFLSGYEEALKDEATSIPIDVTTNQEDPKLIKLRWVRMEGNRASQGGALYSRENTLFDAANLIMTANQAEENGGGIHLVAASGSISNSVITGNSAPTAAGILLNEALELNVINCIVNDNSPGEGILAVESSNEVWQYNNVHNNQGGDYAGMPSATGTMGNISQAPLFVDPTENDFHLMPESPCIDTGHPDPVFIDSDDTPSDMGAYGGPHGKWEITDQSTEDQTDDATIDQTSDVTDDQTSSLTDDQTNALTDDQTGDLTDDQTGDLTDDQTSDTTDDQADGCPSAVLSVAENFHWPAGGHEVILRAEGANGTAWEGSADCLTIESSQSAGVVEFEITPHTLGPGITLIAVQPGLSDNLSTYQSAIEEFIASRPQEEKIALYGWGSEFVQITDFTTRRERVIDQLDRLERIFADQNSLAPGLVLEQALEIVTRVEEPNLRGLRSIVFISGNSITEEIPASQKGISIQWVIPENKSVAQPRQNVFETNGSTPLEESLAQASRQLDQEAQNAYYKIAICANPHEKTSLEISLGSASRLTLDLDAGLDGEQEGSCNAAQITEGDRSGVDTINFFLTEEEVAVYQQRIEDIKALRAKYENLPDALRRAAILMETSINGWGSTKENWTLSVSLDPTHEPVEAKAHFRGQNALFCGRKSYTVNLSGKDARFFGDGSGSDEFYLIAMCQDSSLFHAYLADTLYSQYDLFPLRFRYVELFLNNETQGIYLMMEKREEELIRDSARLRGVVRRRYEGATQPEIEYTINDEKTMLAAYRQTLGRSINENALPRHLREVMDLDQYLTWMGVNSMLENADTLDECLFISTESIDAAGLPTDYFRLMSWDPEDMQGTCPSGDLHRNDYDLTFCQESSIERRIINQPTIFKEYVDLLRRLVAENTSETYQLLLDRIQSELFPLLEREGVIEAMQLPDITDVQSAKEMILNAMQQSKEKFESRRAALLEGIESYDAGE